MARFPCATCGTRSQFNSQTHVVNERLPESVIEVWRCTFCSSDLATWRTRTTGAENASIIWPTQRNAASVDIPEEVRTDFDDAVTADNSGLSKPALMSARASLQSCMRKEGAQGKSLADEIDDLATRGILPAALKAWAHEVRLAGNLAAHPKPGAAVTKAEAEEIIALAESIFEYLYVVPAAVTRRRESAHGP